MPRIIPRLYKILIQKFSAIIKSEINGKTSKKIQTAWPSAAAAIMFPLYVGDSGEHEAFVIGEPKMLDFDSSENLLNILQSFRDCHCLY